MDEKLSMYLVIGRTTHGRGVLLAQCRESTRFHSPREPGVASIKKLVALAFTVFEKRIVSVTVGGEGGEQSAGYWNRRMMMFQKIIKRSGNFAACSGKPSGVMNLMTNQPIRRRMARKTQLSSLLQLLKGPLRKAGHCFFWAAGITLPQRRVRGFSG